VRDNFERPVQTENLQIFTGVLLVLFWKCFAFFSDEKLKNIIYIVRINFKLFFKKSLYVLNTTAKYGIIY